MAILADALDLCCFRMQQSAATAAASAACTESLTVADTGTAEWQLTADDGQHAVAGQQTSQKTPRDDQQLAQHLSEFSDWHQVLGSLLAIISRAAKAAAAAAAADSSSRANNSNGGKELSAKEELAAAAAAGAAESSDQGRDEAYMATAGGDVQLKRGQWLLGGVGAVLLHHLDLVVALAASGTTAQLPVDTVSQYIQVCTAVQQQCDTSRNSSLVSNCLAALAHSAAS